VHYCRGWWKVIAAQSLAREIGSRVVDDADAGRHHDVWPLLVRCFRVENGELAGQGFEGQVRIAKLRDWLSSAMISRRAQEDGACG
jgi:hypothetical protein